MELRVHQPWCRLVLQLFGFALRGCSLLGIASLTGCAMHPAAVQPAHSLRTSDPVAVYVARRTWHVDVGFAATDLDPSLAPVKAEFATAKYLFFGFGDRRYLLARRKNGPVLLRALWPGPALILVTALAGPPTLAFGQSQVIRIELSANQAQAMQSFIRASMTGSDPRPLAPGPYAGSTYYAAPQQYSALHTCNTWAAEALQTGGQPVRARGVVFAGQLWRQLMRLAPAGIAVHVVR